MKGFSKELQIALVAIIGVVILFFGLQFLKGIDSLSESNTYHIEFDDIKGLSSSSAIFVSGYKVGSVHNIDFGYGNGKKTVVSVGVDKEMRIPKGTTAEIESDMLGNTTINLILGENIADLTSPGDTLQGNKNAGMLGKVGAMVPQIEKMMPKLDSILGSLNTLLADPALANSLHNVEGITTNLTQTTRELNTLMASVNKDLPSLMEHTKNTMAHADTITTQLASLDLVATFESVYATLSNVQAMTESLCKGEGSLGLLLNDDALYNNLSSTMASADSLLRDLKANPKRYVHFSLFGKKAK